MSGVIGIILNVLAPLNAAEFRRILCKDGVLLKVIPGKEHFRELRAALYEVDAPGPSLIGEVEAQLYPFFLVIEKQRLNWVWQVARVPLHDILTMGPLFWKAKKAKMKAMETTGLAQVTVDLELIIARAR